ncbi:MAG: ferredoxin [Verrucomicrobiota bacterium]|jgi:ferredoxin|nr:ferredoxin [Verrucomicrobiota bacterium]
MKASVDQSICTGCSLCPDIDPAVFEIGDDGLAKVKVDEVPADAEDATQEAADSCPVSAITVG